MRANVLVFTVCVLLASAACAPARPVDDGMAARVAELESQVAELQKRADDLALKGRVVGSLLFRSPLDDFFQSPEFWENTYDSGEADCSRRCIATLQEHRAACLNKPESERLKCFEEASANAALCHKRCAGL